MPNDNTTIVNAVDKKYRENFLKRKLHALVKSLEELGETDMDLLTNFQAYRFHTATASLRRLHRELTES